MLKYSKKYLPLLTIQSMLKHSKKYLPLLTIQSMYNHLVEPILDIAVRYGEAVAPQQ